MCRNNFCVDILIADVGVQLVSRAQRRKYREGRSERHKACSCHTGGNTEHILLRNADIENAVGASVGEVLQFGRGRKVGGNRHNFLVLFGKVCQGFPVNFRSGKLGGFNYVVNKSSCHYSNSFPQRAIRSALYSSKSFAATFAISSSIAP